jgi:hypothetical protein
MSSISRTKRVAAAALLAGAGALSGLVLTPATADANPDARGTGPFTWCPGQHQGFAGGGPDRPAWDWNVCHTYWWVHGTPGNVAPSVWEGALPPADIPLENLSRPPFNCGLFFCQDPGGRYTVDPRVPAP